MNSISIVSSVIVCTVECDDENTISVRLFIKGGSPIGQWNFSPNEPYGTKVAEKRRVAVKLTLSSLFRECIRRGLSVHDSAFVIRSIVQIALKGRELSDLEAGMPFFTLVDVLTDIAESR